MGRYDFRPIRVLQHANQLLETRRITTRPPWQSIIAQIPPGETIVRPVKRFDDQPGSKRKSRSRRSSRMFQPLTLEYPEDKLRSTFFGDHPWELARPRTLVESDGNDSKHWDWSRLRQPRKPLDGESVVRRQLWLIQNHHRRLYEAKRLLAEQLSERELEADALRTAQSEFEESSDTQTVDSITSRSKEIIKEYRSKIAAAQSLVADRLDEKTLEERMYDQARKEFYQLRLEQDVERQVIKEEALHYGSYFEQSALEKSLKFEDDAFEDWKEWAFKDIELMKNKNAAMFAGGGTGGPEDETDDPLADSGDNTTLAPTT